MACPRAQALISSHAHADRTCQVLAAALVRLRPLAQEEDSSEADRKLVDFAFATVEMVAAHDQAVLQRTDIVQVPPSPPPVAARQHRLTRP